LIKKLDLFEEIRYPDRILKLGLNTAVSMKAGDASPPPRYEVVIEDTDRLVATIFSACSRNPFVFTSGLSPHARDMLTRDNVVSAQLVRS